MSNHYRPILWLAAMFLGLSSCGQLDKTEVLRLAHGLDVTHPVHRGLERLGEVADSISNGQLQIAIYPNGQLGSESQCLELLQLGSLSMTKVSAAVMERFAPAYSVLSLPYLFPDRETSFRVLDGPVGQEILSEGTEARLRGLTFMDAGTRCFYTKEAPVSSPEDVEGLKVRVQSSPMAIDLIKSLGGSPTPIAYGELYTALQQGIVDAAENNLPSYYTSRHYEVCPYYSYDHHTSVPDVIVIGTHTWNRMSEEERGWLREAAKIATDFQRLAWQAAEQEAIEELTKFGVTFQQVDVAPFREAVEPMYEQARQNPAMGPLLGRILTANESR